MKKLEEEIESIINDAKKENFITEDDITNRLSKYDYTPEEESELISKLEKMGIVVEKTPEVEIKDEDLKEIISNVIPSNGDKLISFVHLSGLSKI